MKLFNFKKTHPAARINQDPLSRRIFNDPYLDWKILLGLTMIAALIFIALGYYTYEDAETQLNKPAAEYTGSTLVFDKAALARVLKQFSDRSAEKSQILSGGAGIVSDPSR